VKTRMARLQAKRKCPKCGEARRVRKVCSLMWLEGYGFVVPWRCKVCDTLFGVPWRG